MDVEAVSATIAASVAALSTLFAAYVVAVVASEYEKDGRSWKGPKSRRFACRTSQFSEADSNPIFDDGWFPETLRCTKASFNVIVEMIEKEWAIVHRRVPAHNSNFSIRERVAVCIHYLTHSGSLADSAKIFGMGRSSVWRYIEEVIQILITRIGPSVVKLPESLEEWERCSQEFEGICNFPDACLAVDGSLIELERTLHYEGWYSRKGWPAINLQVVVDARKRFRDYCMRPGSENDRGVYSRSRFGKNIHKLLPNGKCILADAGYQLYAHCLTPYEIRDDMPSDERNYNYLHSRSRITVECALGLLKGRFRRFKCPLGQKGNINNGWRPERKETHPSECAARVIRACLILHNVLIDVGDAVNVPEIRDPSDSGHEGTAAEIGAVVDAVSGDAAKRVRDAVKNYLTAFESNKRQRIG
jgi:hypothetical protein